MRAPSYSVCMTNRNTAPILAETLRTILEQLPPSSEVVVVDAASSDGSVEILRSFAPRVALIEAGPVTRGMGREMAWRAATGEVILQLDCDRPLRPGAVQELLGDLARIRGEHGDVAIVSEDLALYPRWLMEQVGGYNPQLNYGEDREIYDKMMRRDSMVFVPKHYTILNWSLEQGRLPPAQKLRRAFEMARDIHRVGVGFGTYMGEVQRTRGLGFALVVFPIAALGHLVGVARGRITESISPRTRTVRP